MACNSQDMHALFVVSIYNYHREVRPVVEAFRRNGWKVTTAIGWLGRTADEAASDYDAMGCCILKLPADIAYQDAESSHIGKSTMSQRKPQQTDKRRLIRRLVSFALLTLRLLNMRRRVAHFMNELKPHIVFQGPFHSCARFDNGFAREVRRRGVMHCCYPVSAYHGRKPAVMARFNNLALGMLPTLLRADFDLINRFLAWALPDWTQTHNGVTIFMWDPLTMLISRLTGLIERDVWQKPSPDFDAVFVFNYFSQNLLKSNGFPMNKVVVSGIPLLDASVARMADPVARLTMLADLNLDDGEPFLLFNVEPSAEHHYCKWDRHWENFCAMMRLVTALGLPVVLSLHPLCRLEDYLFAEPEFGVRIARTWKIHDLYPACAFVVSFPCSTNLIAEVFDKPLAIYDFFLIAHPDSPRVAEFRLPGALVGHTIDEIAANVSQLAGTLYVKVGSSRGVEGSRSGALLPAPTFVMASDVIRRHAEQLLRTRLDGGLVCVN
jgi:hypothetical protein